ncbi:bifunctional TH2 protein, mitochondrial-like isoform X3 [Amaranthus tricolor]|nr:bifunctional TH2 protein, mitochondrial-like isoform X3 [Amaranthus tricolor]
MVDSQSESFSKQLWEKHKKQAILSQYTPFIISLAAGNLPVHTFEAYLYQDIHYLTAYAQAAYIAEEYAADAESKEKLQKLGDYSILYIQTCSSFFEELGLKYKPGSVPKNEATIKYIDFLLKAARTKITVYTFAAMTPCNKIYTYLGWEVKNALSAEQLENNKYKRWIEENTSKAMKLQKRYFQIFNQKSVKSMEYFIDKLSVGLPEEELDKIEEYYKKGLEHETQFFLAQEIVGQEVVVPLWKQLQGLKWSLVSDFDLCLTKSSCDLEILKVHEKLIANELLRAIPPGEYNFTAIREAFKLVCELEKTSFSQDDRFGQFEVDSGCNDLLLKVWQKDNLNASAHVISACQNDDDIKSALIEEGLIGKVSHAGNKGSVESSIDKLEAFIENRGKKLSLYIGDSVRDLLCLLKSDIPIVHESNEQLIK